MWLNDDGIGVGDVGVAVVVVVDDVGDVGFVVGDIAVAVIFYY